MAWPGADAPSLYCAGRMKPWPRTSSRLNMASTLASSMRNGNSPSARLPALTRSSTWIRNSRGRSATRSECPGAAALSRGTEAAQPRRPPAAGGAGPAHRGGGRAAALRGAAAARAAGAAAGTRGSAPRPPPSRGAGAGRRRAEERLCSCRGTRRGAGGGGERTWLEIVTVAPERPRLAARWGPVLRCSVGKANGALCFLTGVQVFGAG